MLPISHLFASHYRLCLKTDKEKCSAWIRMAVNLNLLGSYISALNQDKSLLRFVRKHSKLTFKKEQLYLTSLHFTLPYFDLRFSET